ncbi:MAG TPA: isoleucine--tRNA ligase [Acholeplasmataceae bacterium]|jgi:isoleucyl-tRNA synthetase|nr:isoleucine--tRNA ligase [Acholeplasmataceae bacterium]
MSKDYKDTLLMMKTAFSMRANLTEKEPQIQKHWEEKDVYRKVLEKNQGHPVYNLHDGPPYANGDIHVGHALNKILKDFVIRYRSMNGFYAPYIPGWDTHGLPIETALTKNKKVNRKAMSIPEFRKLCEEYALKQVEKQKLDFKRLGILGDWDNPYLTLNKEYEAEQIRIFGKMVAQGLVFKGLKPVYWSPSSESALAEAEIEYHDKVSPSIYLAFKVLDGKNLLSSDCELVIWTTTPWTIPANLAVSVHPEFEYVVLFAGERYLVVAKELVEAFVEAVGYKDHKIIKTITGIELEGITYSHPLNGKVCPVVLADYVTLESGTGLVHTAPGHGEDDFMTGKKYDLETLCVVDEKGYMTEEAGEFAGIFYEKANDVIIERLYEVGSLLQHSKVTHSYPHDWRTHKPIIFRATSQWFASIDALKEDMLEAIKTVTWIPAWGEARMENMVKDRKEWCISRQRVWGVPIPVFYAEDGSAILDEDVINHVADLFAEHGSSVWWEKEAKDLLPEGYSNSHSPNNIFTKETDIMDVWFDSGSSHHASMVLSGQTYPADLYLEGSDQYRGWFNSSLSTGIAITKKAPYRAVLTHGFVLDGEGRKMSKSLGNSVDPQDMIRMFGADILRLWVAGSEYTADIRISNEIMKQAAENYRKIRNTFRFLLGNLSDFNPENDRIPYEQMPEIDQVMMNLLNNLIDKVVKAYENYQFDEVYRSILTYMTNELSAFYLDFTKDVLYIETVDNPERRSIQTVFYENLSALVRLLTPIIPHTTEEVYSHIPYEKEESVYFTNMPKSLRYANGTVLLNKYELFKDLRSDVLKALEEARNNKIIGKSLASKVVLKPSEATLKLLNSFKVDLAKVFIVSEFVVTNEDLEGDEYKSGIIQISAREGHVCGRCWKVVDEVNEEELCNRCNKIIKIMRS